MPLGLEVTNSNGKKQLIEKAPVLVFTETLSGANSYNIDDNNNIFVSENFLYASCPSDNHTLLVNSFSRKIDTINTNTTDIFYTYRSKGIGDFYIFKHDVPILPSSFGLEIFNSQGVVEFSSNQKPLKILDTIFLNDIRNTETIINGNKTFWYKDYGSKKVALLYIETPFWTENPFYMTVAPAKRGNIFALEAAQEHADGQAIEFGSNIVPSWQLQALVIDVTNY